jgi:hypothetical protein
MDSAPAKRRLYANDVMRGAVPTAPPDASPQARLPTCWMLGAAGFPNRQHCCFSAPSAAGTPTGTAGISTGTGRSDGGNFRSSSPGSGCRHLVEEVACGRPPGTVGTPPRRAAEPPLLAGPSRTPGGAMRLAGGPPRTADDSGAELLCLVYHVSGVRPLRPSDLRAHSGPSLGCCRTPWMCRCHRS